MRNRCRLIFLSLIVMAPYLLGGCAGTTAKRVPAEGAPTISMETSASQPDPAALLQNGSMPFEGILVGGQPTVEQFARMSALGYKTVINMRQPGEEGSTNPGDVEALGMTYIAIPVAGAAGINDENARLLAMTLEKADYPVVVHCGSGNRVGAIFAMKAYLVDGRTAEESLAIGKKAGLTRLEPVLREKLGLEETAD